MSIVTKGIDDRGERTNGGHGSEQDGSGTERLADGDIEAGSGGGDSGMEGLLHESSSVPGARSEEVRGGLAATGSVDGLPKFG